MEKIYFFIGTKAQAIKCMPLVNFLSRECNVSVEIINSGQHTKITENNFRDFDKNVTYKNVFTNKENISKYSSGFIWILNFMFKYLFFKTLKKQNNRKKYICVIHGDTVSTLMGLLWAKRNSCTVLHLESGLTSKAIFNPFPEEIIRRLTSKFSDILICFDPNSYKRLVKKYKNKHILEVTENTIYETLKKDRLSNNQREDVVTATLHRTENIFSKKRIQLFVDLLSKLDNFVVNWYLHEPTLNAINKFNIQIPSNINKFNLINHDQFITELNRSKIVITDGGSIQEECFYIGNITIVWRKTTERPYAMNSNMFISNFELEKSLNFIENNLNLNFKKENVEVTPSREIVDFLVSNKLLKI